MFHVYKFLSWFPYKEIDVFFFLKENVQGEVQKTQK